MNSRPSIALTLTITLFAAILGLTGLTTASTPAWAAKKQTPERTFNYRTPPNWKAAENQLGIDLVMQGPEQNGLRPAFSMVDSRATKARLDVESLEAAEDEYFEGRSHWLSQVNGKSIGALPSHYRKFPNGVEAYSIGHRYRLGDSPVEFKETTYYLVCNSHFYIGKSTIPVDGNAHVEASETDIQTVLESLQCK